MYDSHVSVYGLYTPFAIWQGELRSDYFLRGECEAIFNAGSNCYTIHRYKGFEGIFNLK
jgi:hypothetical protein